MTALERLVRRLVQVLESRDPAGVHRPVTISDLRDTLVPYRANRTALGLSSSEDYELLVLSLVAESEGWVRTYPPDAVERARAEVAEPNPDLDLVESLGEATIQIGAASLARLRATETEAPAHEPSSSPAGDPAPAPEPAAEATPSEPPVEEPPAAGEEAAAQERPVSGSAPPRQPPPPPPATPPLPPPFESLEAEGLDLFGDRVAGRGGRGSVSCPSCSGQLPDKRPLVFCPHCGLQLGTARCLRCGGEIEVGWRHCVICGHRVPGAGPETAFA